jgi:hypothetical protein
MPFAPRARREIHLRRPLVVSLLVAAVGLAALLAASPAEATYDPIGSGQTTLRLAPSFLSTLRAAGVELSATAPARLAAGRVSFPVAGGKLDPVSVRGTLEHGGALVFKAGGKSLPMKGLQLKTSQASSPLSAKFGGGKLKLAATSTLTTERSGFGLAMKVSTIRLSGKVATRLEKKLGLRGVFVPNELLGTAVSEAQPATVAIKAGGKAELSIDPAFAAKLSGLFVAVNPVFPTERPGAFTFPIGGGILALSPSIPASGLKTNGALEFIQVGGGQFFARELEVDLSDAVANGESQLVLSSSGPGPDQGGSVFSLGATTPTTEPTARTIGVAGLVLSLEPGTAGAFNEAFCVPIHKPNMFSAGETLGTMTFTAQAE